MRGTEVVTVLRQQRDENGDLTGTVTETELANCLVWPRSTTEDNERGIVPISGYGVWVQGEPDVRADDRVEARGEVYQVEGVPARHRKFSGAQWGTLFMLERVGV